MDNHETAHAFTFARARIVNGVALLQLARIDAKENQLAGVRIRPELEGQRAEFGAVVRQNHYFVFCAWLVTFRRRDVERRWQIIDYGVNQGLHALLLESGAAEHWHQFNLTGQPTNGRL